MKFFGRLNVLLMVLVSSYAEGARANLNYFNELSKISDVVKAVEQGYVEPEKTTDQNKFVEGAIEGILKKLEDPFTRYIPPVNYKSMQEDLEGGFGGIGITWSRENNYFVVIAPIEGSPAFKAGIRAGDRIIKIDGHETKGLSIEEGTKLIKGEVKTKVVLGIWREGVESLIDYTLVRDFIEVSSVKAGFLTEHIAYARLTGFTGTVGSDLKKSIHKQLETSAISGFILDLRGNPGGLVDAAVAVAQLFLPDKSLIVSTKDRKGREVKLNGGGKDHFSWPMVVLLDQGSASASEIVAGALKDQKRALLLGMKSFGKGSVQTVVPLGDGSAIALTTNYYYTPAGIRIHGKGIEPDIKIEQPAMSEEELKQFREEMTSFNKKKVEEITEKQKAMSEGKTLAGKSEIIQISRFDRQLQNALDLLKASAIFSASQASMGISSQTSGI